MYMIYDNCWKAQINIVKVQNGSETSHVCIVRIQQLTTTFSGKGPELQGQFAGSLHWALCLQGWVPMAQRLDLKWRWDVDWYRYPVLKLCTLKSLKVFINNGNTSIHRKLSHIHLDWLPSMIPWLCLFPNQVSRPVEFPLYTIVEFRTEQSGNTEGHPLRSSIPLNRPSIPSIHRGRAIFEWICVAGATTFFSEKVPDIGHLLFWYLWKSIDLNMIWMFLENNWTDRRYIAHILLVDSRCPRNHVANHCCVQRNVTHILVIQIH